MKHPYFFICLSVFLFTVETPGQKITYTYDNSGNRIKREIVLSPQRTSASNEDTTERLPVSDMLADKDIKIYPNPTQGMLKVEITNYESSDSGSIHVYSMNGQTVTHSEISFYLTDIDISNSPNGIYLMQIQLNGTSTTWRIIKQ